MFYGCVIMPSVVVLVVYWSSCGVLFRGVCWCLLVLSWCCPASLLGIVLCVLCVLVCCFGVVVLCVVFQDDRYWFFSHDWQRFLPMMIGTVLPRRLVLVLVLVFQDDRHVFSGTIGIGFPKLLWSSKAFVVDDRKTRILCGKIL